MGASRWAVSGLLLSLAQALPAAEHSYDFVACTHSQRTMVEASADTVAFGVQLWGVVASSTTRFWDGASTHCAGYVRITQGRPVGKGSCKWLTASGDSAVGEFEYPPNAEPVWTWLSGTGALKGIQGSGTFRELFSARPATEGTGQGCRRDWGRYTTP